MSDSESSVYQKIIRANNLTIDQAVQIMGIALRSFHNNHRKKDPSAAFMLGWDKLLTHLEKKGKPIVPVSIKAGQEVVSKVDYEKIKTDLAQANDELRAIYKRLVKTEEERDALKKRMKAIKKLKKVP